MINANVLVMLGTIVIPLAVIGFVGVVAFVNVYLNIRRRFPAKVNCWFCNTNTKVPYDQSNSFVCPSCRQYNGFTADGDYNREIPEQYQQHPQQQQQTFCYNQTANVTDDDKWGKSTRSIGHEAPRNGLCFGCNRNQELKIHQLASFVPEEEDNYDVEVEEYRKQLEQAYKLCGRCERVLKRALNDVKRNILGSKLAQIGNKSLMVLDMHMRASTKQLAHLKRKRWASACVYAIVALLLVKLSQDLTEAGWTVADLILLCPPSILTGATVVVSYALAVKELAWRQLEKLHFKPAVQHTTERIERLGNELYTRYAPKLLFTSGQLLETLSEQVPQERNPQSLLLNGAIIALGAMLASLGSPKTALKQAFILVLCSADCVLNYAQYEDPNGLSKPLLTLAALGLALSCLGQRVIKSNVAGTDMNSSFHKIYSQQCCESDYSDLDTTANGGEQSPASVLPKFSSKISTAGTIRPSLQPMQGESPPGNLSGKSLDTTKSGCPSSFSMSPTNSLFMNSYVGNASKVTGSLFNVAEEAHREPLGGNKALFGMERSPPPGSLLKTPSFSVADFHTASNLHQGRWRGGQARKGGPSSIASARSKQFRYSMSTINQEPDGGFQKLHDDPLIVDDIDRLSISGRASMIDPLRTASRQSLANENPFAQVRPSREELEYDTIATLRQRRLLRPRVDPLAGAAIQENPWGGVPASKGGDPILLPHMSRTSSQSSGFGSQVETTRRNTPTEVDALLAYAPPEVEEFASTSSTSPPSPVPSSASLFLEQQAKCGSSMQARSLFGEQNLFNHALQQPSLGRSGLFFPKLHHTALVNSGPAASINRHIFPPRQSQTPSSYHQQQPQPPSSLAGVGGGATLSLSGFPGSTGGLAFGATRHPAKDLLPERPSQQPTPSSAGTSFYSSNLYTASGRASLLNLSKIVNERTGEPPQPTA